MPPLETEWSAAGDEGYTPFDFSSLDIYDTDVSETSVPSRSSQESFDFTAPNTEDATLDTLLNISSEKPSEDLPDWVDEDYLSFLKDPEPEQPAEKPVSRKRSSLPEKKTAPVQKEKVKAARPSGKEKAEKPPVPVREKQENGNPGQGLIIFCIVAAILFLAVAGLVVTLLVRSGDPYGNRILKNIYVAGVDVGGMSKSEATKAVKEAVGDAYTQTPMVLELPGKTILLAPADTGASLDVRAAIKEAFSIGRTGSGEERQAAFAASSDGYTVDLVPYLHLNETYIHSVLDDYGSGFSGHYTPSRYYLEGTAPVLDEANFDAGQPCQTLVLETGTPGFAVDLDALYQQIMDNYNTRTFLLTVDAEAPEMDPTPLNPDAIYAELCTAPVEPYIDMQTCTAMPGKTGYDFDLNTAKAQLASASYGEKLELPMRFTEPTLKGDDVYFQDVLGYCLTPHGDNAARTENLKLACAALNGLVLQPGDTISYNAILGERTAENGYKPAPAYSGTRLIDSIGGGICQVSSTLYLASLFAELDAVDRVNHGYPVAYIPAGLDATVSWGSPDLKIQNNSLLPVKIVAEEADGFVKIWIMGTETRDYTVKMEFNAGGRFANAYKNRYDKNTNQQIYHEMACRSAYLDEGLSAAGEIAPGEAYINGMVRLPDVPNTYSAGRLPETKTVPQTAAESQTVAAPQSAAETQTVAETQAAETQP